MTAPLSEQRTIARLLFHSVAALTCLGVAPVRAPAQSTPAPDTSWVAPIIEFDFAEFHVGIAAYAEGPTGVTVFHFLEPVKAAIDVRGGAPGVLNSELLHLGRDHPFRMRGGGE